LKNAQRHKNLDYDAFFPKSLGFKQQR